MVLQSSTNTVETARYLVHDNQKWTVTPAGGGLCKISSVAGENALAADETVDVAPFTGENHQLWKIDQLDDGSYRIASRINNLALTATINKNTPNHIALQSFTGDDAQRWVITAP
jgi:arabinan endo-1,5-alpha-L-arabinosidase